MLEVWGYELLKGLVKFFLNPLLYWSLILLMLISFRRIKSERKNFASKIYPLFSEVRGTWLISLVFGVILSFLSIVVGVSVSGEVLIILILVTFILSILGSLSKLSPSYTFGFTYLILLFFPFLPLDFLKEYVTFSLTSPEILTYIALLTAMLILAEAFLIRVMRKGQTYPNLIESRRGGWIGRHDIKKMAIIPFVFLLPVSGTGGIEPIFPLLEIGNQSYQLVFFPFLIGFHFSFQGALPVKTIEKYFYSIVLLALTVLLFAIASVYISILSLVAIIIAIIGRGFIKYRYTVNDRKEPPYFTQLNRGIRVLAIKPKGPADRLGIAVGETIVKVNDELVTDSNQFYEALQNSGAFFKLEVLDIQGEVRFVTSAFFEEDHYELGLLFPEAPFLYHSNK